jgi:hypothetical protein
LPAVSTREIAAQMPHRRGLGERAVDQRAETELGRLVLRGTLTADQGLAGETYLALWRGYVWTLAGPAELAQGGGHGFTCDGCEVVQHCRCWFRRKVYEEAQRALLKCGHQVSVLVTCVVVHDLPALDLDLLRIGLDALARHFGLLIGRDKCGRAGSARSGTGLQAGN